MRRALLAVAGCVLALSLTGAARAHDYGHYRPAPHHSAHGVRFAGGYCYTRYEHPHWGGRVWDAHYHRYHYYDPYLRVYYYWDPRPGGVRPRGHSGPRARDLALPLRLSPTS